VIATAIRVGGVADANIVGLRSHGVSDAAAAGDEPSYPVLVMSPAGFRH
jgi:hypothetical protein